VSLSGPHRKEPLFEDDLWHVRHSDPPFGVAGWLMLVSRRHVAGPAHFDDREARSFGLVLRHFEKVLEEVTGALRIYTAAMGESAQHFHAHMVPRYPVMPQGARAWAVFDLERASKQGEISVDPTEVRRISEAFRQALVAAPPPRA
jgi:diadenosine tetraphosphate (Ap4A) HIT family hydrolase